MNPWPTNENDAAFYYCVVIKTNFFTIKISLTVTGQSTATAPKHNSKKQRRFHWLAMDS
jgi:hypothetical protein